MSIQRRRAFSLIEILIVVSIISILAAIAVPNFLEAQVRAKVARTKNDMRTLATGLEAYRVDHNSYPYRRNLTHDTWTVPESWTRLEQMSVITTPVAYLSSLPVDVFEKILRPPNNVIDYYDAVQAARIFNVRHNLEKDKALRKSEQESGWVLVSVGPDGLLNCRYDDQCGWPRLPNRDQADQLYGYSSIAYDPTNGSTSAGNIFRGQIAADNQVWMQVMEGVNPH